MSMRWAKGFCGGACLFVAHVAQAAPIADYQLANFLYARAQLRMNVDRSLRNYPDIQTAFSRLGIRPGCDAWKAALDKMDEKFGAAWQRAMVEAARGAFPQDVLTSQMTVAQWDEQFPRYRPAVLQALMAGEGRTIGQAAVNDVLAAMTSAASADSSQAASADEIHALKSAPGALCGG